MNIKTRAHSEKQELQHLTNEVQAAFREVVFQIAVSWLFIRSDDGYAPVDHPMSMVSRINLRHCLVSLCTHLA